MERNKTKIKFAGLYLAAILLIIVIVLAFWKSGPALNLPQKTAATTDNKNTLEHQIVISDALLHFRLRQLQALDAAYYALFLTDTTVPADRLNSTSKMIADAEEAFQKTIDSINLEGEKYRSADKENRFENMMGAFKAALQNRRSTNIIQTVLINKKNGLNTEQQNLLKWQNELLEKDNRIAELEHQLKAKTNIPAAGTTENNDDLERRNENLRTALNVMDTKVGVLTKLTNELKQDNDRLTSQLKEQHTAKGTTENTEATLQVRNATLQRRLEELTTELSFAKVDCNLSRADAKQIISNSRQRKDLLTEALHALNVLSKSDNIAVQQKAKEKMDQLNRLATTLRD